MKWVIYKTTFPNGKIYVGQDRTNSITYFGSASAALVAADFSEEDRRSFTVTREILWEGEPTSQQELNVAEKKFILEHRSNDPAIGYNRTPKFLS